MDSISICCSDKTTFRAGGTGGTAVPQSDCTTGKIGEGIAKTIEIGTIVEVFQSPFNFQKETTPPAPPATNTTAATTTTTTTTTTTGFTGAFVKCGRRM